MFSKQTFLILTALVLAGIYVYFFTDWINTPRIQIIAQTRPIQPRGPVAKVYPVSFLLDGKYKLRSVKVVPIASFETNKFTPPSWHLIAYTNVPPTEGFLYGQRLPGMHPWMTNARPQRLEANTAYRLFVEAGRAKGQVDFRTSGLIEPNN
jgi:hypothetical protein